jgi:hypothetical protein
MGIDNLRKKNNITAPVSQPDKNKTGGTTTTAAPVKKNESGQSRSGDPGAGSATSFRPMDRNNSDSGSGDAGGTVGPGIYTGLPMGSSTGSGSGSGSGSGFGSGHGGSSIIPRELPDLWQVDAIFMLLTIAGIIAIVMNLNAVLFFIFKILYAIINVIFIAIFYICLFVGGFFLLFRRRRR